MGDFGVSIESGKRSERVSVLRANGYKGTEHAGLIISWAGTPIYHTPGLALTRWVIKAPCSPLSDNT